jgi:N-acetylglucosamine-6-phosphate deacetylase
VSTLHIAGGMVAGPDGVTRADVWVDDGRITSVDEQPSASSGPAGAVLDASGLLIAPGLVDLQCNGAGGIDLTSEPDRLWEVAALLPRWGVTAWLPTIITSPPAVRVRAQVALADGPPDGSAVAQPVGLHFEGPFLAPEYRGAHSAEWLVVPDSDAIGGWSRDAGVAVVTLAPELPGAIETIRALVDRGIVVSAGHSGATAAEAEVAIDAGVRWVTHLFNAMAPMHHREPGLAGVALSDDRVRVGLIADGIHLHPTVVALAARALGRRLMLVTDATAALGAATSGLRLGDQAVTAGAAGVSLADGTLAGSDLSLDRAVRNLIEFACWPDVDALAAAAGEPATLLGLTGKGRVEAGADADLVLVDVDLEVVATVVGGAVAYDRREAS